MNDVQGALSDDPARLAAMRDVVQEMERGHRHPPGSKCPYDGWDAPCPRLLIAAALRPMVGLPRAPYMDPGYWDEEGRPNAGGAPPADARGKVVTLADLRRLRGNAPIELSNENWTGDDDQ